MSEQSAIVKAGPLAKATDSSAVRAVRWIENNRADLLALAGANAFGVLGFVIGIPSLPIGWIVGISAFALFCLGVQVYAFRIKNRDAVSLADQQVVVDELTERVRSAEATSSDIIQVYRDLFEILLENIAVNGLKFQSTERVSVYKHDGETFLMLARFSEHPTHKVTGRGVYRADEGLIARAWEDGQAELVGLPDPATDSRAYEDAQKNQGRLPRDVCKKLTMPSRSYAALAIQDPARTKRKAVIVFESTRPDKVTVQACSDVLKKEILVIGQFLHVFERFEPSLRDAKREGF